MHEPPKAATSAEPWTSGAQAVLFGFEPTNVTIQVVPRSRTWRLVGAARTAGVFMIVAPVVALLPPHAPWGIGALVAGFALARRRWIELFTIAAVDGSCPKCGAVLQIRPQRLRVPHPVSCEGCHHVSSLKLPEELADLVVGRSPA